MTHELFTKLEWSELVRVLIRLSVSVLLGASIGWERERRRRFAGLRTHILVTLSSASFMMLGAEVAEQSNGDPVRVVQAVAMGVGFLGAGTILKLPQERRVEGLTTASSIWTAAAMGVAAGAGWMILAAAIAVLTVLVLAVLRKAEAHALGTRSPADD